MKIYPKCKPFIVICTLCFFAALAIETATAQNLVVNGDFESGNTGFTTQYAFGDVTNPGTYTIAANPSSVPGAYGDWCNCGDHTTGTGMMLIANGASSVAAPVWQEVVKVMPSTDYIFSYWGAEVDHDSCSLPHLALKINGRVIGSSYFPKNSPDNGGDWQNLNFTWNSGQSHTANLVLVDLNTDAGCNDFAIDDISFTAASAGGAPAPSSNASASSPITTHAQISVKDANGSSIALNPSEKVALMFVSAINFMEGYCTLYLQRTCTLGELVAGVKSPKYAIGRLRYDPAMDSNYKYSIAFNGKQWTASVTPRHPGLGGFFVDTSHLIPVTYFNPSGAATKSNLELTEISIDGEQFRVQ